MLSVTRYDATVLLAGEVCSLWCVITDSSGSVGVKRIKCQAALTVHSNPTYSLQPCFSSCSDWPRRTDLCITIYVCNVPCHSHRRGASVICATAVTHSSTAPPSEIGHNKSVSRLESVSSHSELTGKHTQALLSMLTLIRLYVSDRLHCQETRLLP